MKCRHCGLGPQHDRCLFRVNEKGVPGIWECERCLTVEVPQDDMEFMAMLDQALNNPQTH